MIDLVLGVGGEEQILICWNHTLSNLDILLTLSECRLNTLLLCIRDHNFGVTIRLPVPNNIILIYFL